jgi:CO/xanthine dehydrogenase FAD-binding subunit
LKVFLPENLESLWEILTAEPGASLYAGGTDLLVKLRAGLLAPPALICLENIRDLQGIRENGDEVFIGSATTLTALLESRVIAENFPVLRKAVALLGSPPIRNMGTLGGNICTASPAGDTLPPLYILRANVEAWSETGRRQLKITDFIPGPGRTALHPGEILGGIRLKKRPYNFHHFEKIGQRKALAISIASLAALVRTNPAGRIEEIRLAWGSVGPTILVSPEAEERLIGQQMALDALSGAMPLITEASRPIDDIRASAEYRRRAAANLLLRLAEFGPHP